MKKTEKGFTLIELVVVITILGILAAFAIPRFANLEVEARVAATQGLGGSVRSAAALAHAMALAQGLGAGATVVTMEGQDVTMVNRYPTANAAGIGAALVDYTGFTLAGGTFTKTGATTANECEVDYAAAGANASPAIAVTVTDC